MQNSFSISGYIVDVVNRQIFEGEIKIENQKIIDIQYKDNVDNIYILPGLIDSHIHIESSMLIPSEFAKLTVKHGTVATVSDPHEIANVCGIEGINYMIEDSKLTPFKIYFGAPSCVPATSLETAGCVLDSTDIQELIQRSDIHYLSEMMNFPGVIFDDKEVHEKLSAAKSANKPIDGHAPYLQGADLQKYAAAGITTDHESTNIEEAIEKIKLGIKTQIREGSAAKNFDTLHSLIDSYPNEVMLCSDDLHPDDLIKGHINLLIKRALNYNLDFFNTLRAATYNPTKHYKLDVGLLQKGDNADFIVVDNLKDFTVLKTFISGELVYSNGNVHITGKNTKTINQFNAPKISEKDIEIADCGKQIRIMQAIDGELITKSIQISPKIEKGFLVSDIERDILKIVVVNRYKSAKPAIGFIQNFGLKKGAIAGSIAHDSHNIVAVGSNDSDLVNAINKVIENQGGIAACSNSEIHDLKLNVGGIMSNEYGFHVAKKYETLDNLSKSYGSKLRAPFMTLSFMALLVIPELKIGDKGLFDVLKFDYTSLFVD